MAFLTMPLGSSLPGRSNSTTGTLALAQWAAICAPMTPAPSTATLLTMKLLTPLSFRDSGQGFAHCPLVELSDAGARQALDEPDFIRHAVLRNVPLLGERLHMSLDGVRIDALVLLVFLQH